MRRTQAQQIGEIIDEFLQAEHLDTQLDEHRACALWPQIVGYGVNRYTVSRDVRGGVMYVRLTSAALRNELMLNRSRLVTLINETLGRDVIHDIVFQ